MKKNFIFGLFALVTMLFTASCAEEQLVPNSAGDTATVSFKVSTPVLSTRAVGDGNTAKKLYVAVYENLNGTADNPNLMGPLPVSLIDADETVTFNNREATVNLALAKNKEYSVIFWAETENNGEAMFDINWNERKLTLKQSLKANQEKYDAFWAQKTLKISENLSQDVKLTRPFSQLNIGTSDKAAAEAAGVVVNQTKVVVKDAYTAFNLQNGEASEASTVTYAMEAIADIEDETFPADDQSYLSLNYLLMNTDKSTVDVTFSYKDNEDTAPYTLNFNSVPVQRNYRTNIYGTLLTNSANYTVQILPGFPDDAAANIVNVTSQDEFNNALKSNEENIVINLTPTEHVAATRGAGATEYIIKVGEANEKYFLGGAKTKTITINGNGCTINFEHSSGDWNYIRCVNDDAKWIINNAHLTNSGKNNGPWNRHDIRFYNAVELNNVTSDKAIALLNDGTLETVSISDTHPGNSEAYGLWITAAGQTVTLNNCEIIAHSSKTGDRGIKIDKEYLDDDKIAKVTLTVKNTKFVTQKKAAIVVTSPAGANITLENVDLSGVKADGFNAVWVDEKYKDYADAVSVTGGFVIVEGAEDNAESNPFLVENGTVNIPSGHFVMPTGVANGLTIVGATDGTTILDMTGANPSQVSGLTFQNVTLNVSTNLYHGIQHSSELAYNNCVINGTLWLYSTVEFNNCTFNVEGDAYNVWTYGSTEATFTNCTFNCDGKSVLVYNEGGNGSVITMNQCSFFARQAVDGKAAVEIDSSLLPEGKQFIVNLNDCSAEGFGLGSVSNNMLFNHKKGSKASVFVNGTKAVSTIAELNAATETEIYLAGKFIDDAILAKSNKKYLGYDGGVVGCINLNATENVTLEKITFDAEYAKMAYSLRSGNTAIRNANIVTGTESNNSTLGARNITIDGCTFSGNLKSGAAAIAFTDQGRKSGYSGNITIKNCTFSTTGGSYDVYGYYCGYEDFVIANNKFNSKFNGGGHIFLGSYASATAIEVSDNNFPNVASLTEAMYTTSNGTHKVTVEASGNRFGNE